MAPVPPKRPTSQKPRTKLPKSVRPPAQSIHTRESHANNGTISAETAVNSVNSRPLSSHSALPSSKRDKRQIRHSVLLSRLKGNKPGSSADKIQKKRAREREHKRNKTQLSTRLKDLADVLPGEESKGTAAVRQARSSTSTAVVVADAAGLKTKKGHTRRLQKLKELERERYQRNLEVMSQGVGDGSGRRVEDGDVATGQASDDVLSPTDMEAKSQQHQHPKRWEALRAHISRQQGTM